MKDYIISTFSYWKIIQDLCGYPDGLALLYFPLNLERGDKATEAPISHNSLSAFSKMFHSRDARLRWKSNLPPILTILMCTGTHLPTLQFTCSRLDLSWRSRTMKTTVQSTLAMSIQANS